MDYGLLGYVLCLEVHFFATLLQKWKISCFRHEEDCASDGKNPESIGDGILHEELQKSECEKPNAVGKNWFSSPKAVALLPWSPVP